MRKSPRRAPPASCSNISSASGARRRCTWTMRSVRAGLSRPANSTEGARRGRRGTRKRARRRRQANAPARATQLDKAGAHRAPVVGARGLGDQALVLGIAEVARQALGGILRVVAPQRAKPARALLWEQPALDRLEQGTDEERGARLALLGADEKTRAEEDRQADVVGPGEDRAPGAAAGPIELDQAQVELLGEARHELRYQRQRRRGHGELAFFRRVLRE